MKITPKDFKKYVIMIDYDSEGWHILATCDTLSEAIEQERVGLMLGSYTIIVKPVQLQITEVKE